MTPPRTRRSGNLHDDPRRVRLPAFIGAIVLSCFAAGPLLGQEVPPSPIVVISAAYLDQDGDHDAFPDTGETGRVTVRVQNISGVDLTGVGILLGSSDTDVSCIIEPTLGLAGLAAGEIVTLGSLDTALPGLSFRASNSLETVDAADPAVIELCLTVTAAELPSPAEPICFSLLADLDSATGGPAPPISGPDGLPGTPDDGVLLETFDIDKNGDGVFTVDDTFLRPNDVGGTLVYTGTPGLYLRGSEDGVVINTMAGVACAGFQSVEEGNIACSLDPDFPFDWHFHCPVGATDCPNDEILPGDTAPRFCVDGCSYDTPADDAKALSLPNSLHMGAHFSPTDSVFNTTHVRALQAFVSAPINLAASPGASDLQLSFFHIVDLMDNTGINLPDGFCADCANVQVQIDLDEAAGADAWGPWDVLVPFQNVYDKTPDTGSFGTYYCLFTPADTGDAPPAPRGVHETMCFPGGAWSNCGSDRGTSPIQTHDCDDGGEGIVDPSGIGVWVESRFDLIQYAGRRIRVRWIGASWVLDVFSSTYLDFLVAPWGPSVEDDGWWLDDIVITGVVEDGAPTDPDPDDPPPTMCPPGTCNDLDGDGFGLPGDVVCRGGDQTDCDDDDLTINPAAVEQCDGLDNDCDGVVDDGNPGGGAPCGTSDVGACRLGSIQCTGGSLTCVGNIDPVPESCDGLDDDCDGFVDLIAQATCGASPTTLNVNSQGSTFSLDTRLTNACGGAVLDPGLLGPAHIAKVITPSLGTVVLPEPSTDPGCDSASQDGIWETPDRRGVSGNGTLTLRFEEPSDGDCATPDGNRQDLIAVLASAVDGERAMICYAASYAGAEAVECCAEVGINNRGNR